MTLEFERAAERDDKGTKNQLPSVKQLWRATLCAIALVPDQAPRSSPPELLRTSDRCPPLRLRSIRPSRKPFARRVAVPVCKSEPAIEVTFAIRVTSPMDAPPVIAVSD